MCVVPLRQRSIRLTLFQCLRVGEEMYLANILIANDISGRVYLERYISVLIALKYGTSGPSNSSSFSQGLKGSVSTSNDLTTIGVDNL